MRTNGVSLLSKIAAKGVITPYEAIIIQYLNNYHINKQIVDTASGKNPYLAAEKIPGIVSAEQINSIVAFNNNMLGKRYEAYEWAANYMMQLEMMSSDEGYKGLALLNDLRHMRSQFIIDFLIKRKYDESAPGIFLDSIGYSYVNQKRMTYLSVVETFALELRHLIMTIDNVLTLNHFLEELVEIPEIRCLKYLKGWFAEKKHNQEDDEPTFETKLLRSSFAESFSTIINQNHPQFTEFMKEKLSSFGSSLPKHFEEESKQYIQEIISGLNLPTKTMSHFIKEEK